jgi:hypothetical protein
MEIKFIFKKILLICIAMNSLALVGCLNGGDSGGSSTTPATTTPTTPTTTTKDFGFAGVSSVTAIGGTSLKIQWTLATNTTATGYRIYEMGTDGTLTAIASVSSSTTSYNHASLTAGTFHNYVVRAFDASENDGNSTFKGNYTFSGTTSVSITGTTTATVNFPAAGSFADAVNVYGTSRGVTTLLGTATNAATSYAATGLKSGATYTFTAKVSSSGIEYDNLASQSAQTTSNTSTKYKGAMLVQAYGDATGAPTGTPQSRKTVITWNAFTGAVSSTAYSLVRTGQGSTLDSTTTTACTNTTTTSCQVCSATGTGAKTCNDTNVAASPQVYDYTVVLVPTAGWPEEMPASDSAYRITVQIPPNNMVLVHRDAANYEMCQLMGLSSDALNHQRCVYTGIGAAPYSTGPSASPLNLTSGYYDFGYNLFVDRWVAACNWTKSQASGGTGMCGASNTAGDCFGTATPTGTIGVTGNVYYDTDGGTCYYRQAASWIDLNNSSLTTAERALAYTVDPTSNGGFKPPMVNIDQSKSMSTCQASTDGYYGAKRLLRQREYVAMAAWRIFTGEPDMSGTADPLTDTQIGSYENGSGVTAHTTLNYCNASTHPGITATTFTGTELARVAAGGPDSFNIGSVGTKSCVSRYGAQDHVGNVWQWVSDQMTCSTASHTCSGIQSAVDSSNGYSSSFDMNAFLFNGIMGPGSTTAGQVAANYSSEWTIGNGVIAGTGAGQGFGAGYFSFPMGLPMVGNDGGNAKSIAANSAKFHGDYIYLYTDNGNASRGLFAGGSWGYGSYVGRWTSYWGYTPSGTSSTVGFRCALPAE